MSTIDRIAECMAAVEQLIARESSLSASSVVGRTSKFWVDLFSERPNLPDLNQLLAFRRANYGYGMADERQGSLEKECLHAARTAEIFRHTVTPDLVAQVDEPSFGAPYVFSNVGITRSAAFWVNAATAHRVKDFVGIHMPGACRLRVLEIGAGWGAVAYQLHKLLDIATYVIVDLPENLLLSNVYLRATLDKDSVLLSCDSPISGSLPENSIVGTLPATIERMTDKFDLIINSFSLQEMDLDTVRAYINWIGLALSDRGLFVSFNSHGKAGVRSPKDYAYERFHIRHIGMFRRFPSGFFNTIPYEVVLSKSTATSPKADGTAIDALGWLFQLGLDQDLEDMATKARNGTLSRGEKELLHDLAGFFTGKLSKPDEDAGAAIAAYVRAQHALIKGQPSETVHLLKVARDAGLSGFAAVRSDAICSAIERRPIEIPAGGFNAPFAYPELSTILQSGDISPFLIHLNRVTAP